METAILRPKGGYGDVLCISVCLQILKRENPEMDIDVYCPYPYSLPLHNLPQIRCVVEELPKPLSTAGCSGNWRSLVYAAYDLIYEMWGPESRYELSRIPDIPKHRIEMWTDALGLKWDNELPIYEFTPVELKASEWFWKVHDMPEPGGAMKMVGFQIQSANRKKDWRWVKFQELQKLLWAEGVFVCLFGTDPEPMWRNAGTASFHEMGWREMASLIRFMDAVVCLDSGIHHLAQALGIPQLALFGPSSCGMGGVVPKAPLFKHPHYPDCWVYSHSIHEDCVCWFNSCDKYTGRQHLGSPCLDRISPRTVKTAVMGLLDGSLS